MVARREAVVKELLQFLLKNIRGFSSPEVNSSEYERIVGYADDIVGVRNGSEPFHIKEFLARGIKMELLSILTPQKYRQTPSRSTLYPGRDSIFGFLGWGESLSQIIADDERTLRQLNRTAATVGDKLKQVLDAPPRGFNVRIIGSSTGAQPCPFAKHRNDLFEHSNRDYSISRGRQSVVVPGLAWHLIGEHGFFEGKLTYYRIDPTQLVKVLFG